MNDRYQARLAVLVIVLLFLGLPSKLTFGPIWAVPLVVAVLLVPIIAMTPTQMREGRIMRVLTIVLVAALNVFNVGSVVLLIADLLNTHAAKHSAVNAVDLLRYGALIWIINVAVYALWYWELDGDGPFTRARHKTATESPSIDFLFPQMSMDRARFKTVDPNWKPLFLDYLYLSFTNALAISPTDVMPLSRVAKMLMLLQSLISFTTVALILARSVNIMSG